MVIKFATLTKFSAFIPLTAVYLFSGGECELFDLYLFFQIFCMVVMYKGHAELIAEGEFDNARIVKACSMIEVMSYFCLVFALGPMIGIWYTLTLILFPLGWFLVMNQIIWGAWRPKV